MGCLDGCIFIWIVRLGPTCQAVTLTPFTVRSSILPTWIFLGAKVHCWPVALLPFRVRFWPSPPFCYPLHPLCSTYMLGKLHWPITASQSTISLCAFHLNPSHLFLFFNSYFFLFPHLIITRWFYYFGGDGRLGWPVMPLWHMKIKCL